MTSDMENDGASRSQSPDESSIDQDIADMAENPEVDGKPAVQNKSSNGQVKSASNAKDPLRPRRKKARRACYACQRAHLTCGKCYARKLRSATCHIATLLMDLKVTRDLANDVSNVAYRTHARMVFARKRSICMTLPLRL